MLLGPRPYNIQLLQTSSCATLTPLLGLDHRLEEKEEIFLIIGGDVEVDRFLIPFLGVGDFEFAGLAAPAPPLRAASSSIMPLLLRKAT